jgi:2,5-dihydroxypyridine 5,6-dioxygenase
MMQERIEGKWIAAFRQALGHCRVVAGEPVAILSETQSRPVNVALAELALLDMGARPFHLVVPTPAQTGDSPVRSTGGTFALAGARPVLAALKSVPLVVDLTVEGLLHAPERPEILAAGTRIYMISNEHPEALERLLPDPALKEKVRRGVEMALAAATMRVTSPSGTDISVRMPGAKVGGGWGGADTPGTIDYWPGGLCAFYPAAGAVSGRVAMQAGDVNLTFKRYLESPIALTVESDEIVSIDGDGVDADLLRAQFAGWAAAEGHRGAYHAAHLGWGMNPRARWDSLAFYDKRDFNGTELRAFAGNFLFSTGANHFANRFTLGHFDLPMRGCTVSLDGRVIVDSGRLLPPLA